MAYPTPTGDSGSPAVLSPLLAPETARERIEAQAQQQHCLRRAVAVLGALFSVLTVAINLADVVTDTIVAVQFYRDGHMTWFWLVLSSLLIAHVVYTILGAQAMTKECLPCLVRKPAVLRYAVAFVFAQLMPFLSVLWPALGRMSKLLRRCRRRCARDDTKAESSSSESDPPVHASGRRHAKTAPAQSDPDRLRRLRNATMPRQAIPLSAQEELDTLASSSYMNQVMSTSALKEHLMKYGLFYVESAVEAAPQAIIQLLAITFLGKASPAQLVSLCCSLFSITSKAFIISQAYDVRLIVFKFALAAHDVFSTFYLFSTLLARETHKDTAFFGLEVSWLGYVWLWKVVVQLVFAALSGVGVLSFLAATELKKPLHVAQGFAAFCGVVVLAIPGVLLFEAVKLTWVNVAQNLTAPGRAHWTSVAALARFTEPWHEGGWLHGHPRVRFLIRRSIETELERVERQALTSACLVWSRRVQAYERSKNTRTGPAPSAAQPSASAPTAAQKQELLAQARQRGIKDARTRRRTLAPLSRLVADTVSAVSSFSLWRLYWTIQDCIHGRKNRPAGGSSHLCAARPEIKEIFGFAWALLGLIAAVGGQLISLAYPFANAASQAGTHNMLQSTCFVATCAALLVVLVLSPVAIWGFIYLQLIHPRMLSMGLSDVDLVAQAVADYHTPPYVGCLQETVPVPVLPAEVTAEVAGFLTAPDIGLGRLTIAECNAMKRRVAERHSFAIGAGDEDGNDEGNATEEDSDDGAAQPASDMLIDRDG